MLLTLKSFVGAGELVLVQKQLLAYLVTSAFGSNLAEMHVMKNSDSNAFNPCPSQENDKVRALEFENSLLHARIATLGILSSIEADENPNNLADSTDKNHADFPFFEFNSLRDTCFSHDTKEFEKTLHIFNAEYFGIRAAAGNLPGDKLAISAEKKIPPQDFVSILEKIAPENYKRIVMHGYSSNMDEFAKRLYDASNIPLFLVWHGNFAQLVYEGERNAFDRWLRLQEGGLVTRAHILKQNSSSFLKHGYNPMLLNLPPRWCGNRPSAAFQDLDSITAFLPSWPDIRKNWHANMLAGERSRTVQNILYYADVKPVFPMTKKSTRLKFDMVTHMDVVSSADIVLNATLIDCHPMVDLEALACRTPTITAKLFLGELDTHPYAQLTSVNNALDSQEIADSIDRVAAVPYDEMNEIMQDYSSRLIATSISRYAEFLKL